MVCDEFSFSSGDEGQGTLGCSHHIENFIPMKKRQEIRDGEIVTWEEPAIHNFVFVHDSYNGIMKVKKGLDILQFILNPLSPITKLSRSNSAEVRDSC